MLQLTPKKSPPPLILVTNDDGVTALGITCLAEQLKKIGEVLVVAPDQERSAVGHGISLTKPLRIKSHGPGQYATSGTPVDAVLLGMFHLCPRIPDLVVSGINLGLNLGTDVFYSGTVAGALEGTIHHVPAIATSQELPHGDSPSRHSSGLKAALERTARFTAKIAQKVLESTWPMNTALNINAPAMPDTEDFCWTHLGQRVYRERVERREDLRGDSYFWVGGPVVKQPSAPGTDVFAIESKKISLTLLSLDISVQPPASFGDWTVAGDKLGVRT